ncbi:MAG: alpha/beta hydrolase [Chloroflexi bacterium]|nr:alpha/beta hydrolase [Chloroflexota bacterium]
MATPHPNEGQSEDMALNLALEDLADVSVTRELFFPGDEVRLAGQIDYPTETRTPNGFPLLFVLNDSGCTSRRMYDHYANLGLDCGYAVFRWDKRGTGRSGASGRGSATRDAVYAYQTALEQPGVDPNRVVILAVGGGTALLGNTFAMYKRIQRPAMIVLVSNQLDSASIEALDTRLAVVAGEHDWSPWLSYVKAACDAHRAAYTYGTAFYVAPRADRMLMTTKRGAIVFHDGARKVMRDWLNSLDQALAYS